MRAGAVFFIAAIAGTAYADPPIQPVGTDVLSAVRAMTSGKAEAGRETLEQLVKSGRADAAEALGEVLQSGVPGVPMDDKAACRYFEAASNQRGDAMHNLAHCYERGLVDGAPNLPLAAQLYEKAGAMGFVQAKCALGNLYRMGHGVTKDPKRGLALCKEAAEAGAANAQTDVGDVYLRGEVVPRDFVEARRWYEKAAAQGQANAALILGQIYWNGDGVKKDNAKAAEYWRIAYAGGRIDAAKLLGDEAWVRSQRDKERWDPDGLQEAHDWYAKAVDASDPEIRKEAVERRDLAAQLADVMRRRR
jgi:TPR repeat protein